MTGSSELNEAWQAAVKTLPRILVLDDDPTGIQTVHDVPVYTSWDRDALEQAFAEPSRLVYLLTNSRALTPSHTAVLHTNLARNLRAVVGSALTAIPYLLISRGDSTLRGHFPLETQILHDELGGFDGEIIVPFFGEGGRITCGDTHYVLENGVPVPVGETEFARDPVFGYRSSNLRDWIAEKTDGAFAGDSVTSIAAETLQSGDTARVTAQLCAATGFAKVIVNAGSEDDLKVFVIGLADALIRGKRFLFRTAASFVRVIGGLCAAPLLTAADLVSPNVPPGPGLILVGSYVEKTTRQLAALRAARPDIVFIEWCVSEADDDTRCLAEAIRVARTVDVAFGEKRTACVFTTRRSPNTNPDFSLERGTKIAEGMTEIVRRIGTAPRFLIGKGGITSSDIGVNGLGVKRALAHGQIAPGVPVWQTGAESRFPGVPLVIFPGNVGGDHALADVVERLQQ